MLKKLGDSVGRIENVCCDIEYRGKGLAKQLLDEVFSFAVQTLNLEKLQLGTYESLGRAINFYLKNGFVEKEELRNSTTHARYYEMILNLMCAYLKDENISKKALKRVEDDFKEDGIENL